MSQAPYFPFYPKDWLTSHSIMLMTPEERGAFIQLLAHAWFATPACTLPKDDATLAKLSDTGSRWRKVRDVVLREFEPAEGCPARIQNPKQFAVWIEMQEHRERRAEAGRKGGNASVVARSIVKQASSNASANVNPLASVIVNPSIEDEVEDEVAFLFSNQKQRRDSFEKLWSNYPRKRGKEDAYRHFTAQVLTRSDLAAITEAITNYRSELEILGTDEQHTKHGSTFFNNDWRDYAPGSWHAPKPKRNGSSAFRTGITSSAPDLFEQRMHETVRKNFGKPDEVLNQLLQEFNGISIDEYRRAYGDGNGDVH